MPLDSTSNNPDNNNESTSEYTKDSSPIEHDEFGFDDSPEYEGTEDTASVLMFEQTEELKVPPTKTNALLPEDDVTTGDFEDEYGINTSELQKSLEGPRHRDEIFGMDPHDEQVAPVKLSETTRKPFGKMLAIAVAIIAVAAYFMQSNERVERVEADLFVPEMNDHVGTFWDSVQKK